MTDVLDRLGKALAERCITAPLLAIGSLLFPLACGEPGGPDYATLVITTSSLPNAVPTLSYSDTLVATGGDSVYAWSITVGSLPTGLSLTTSSGIISGTPSEEGANTFTVQVASGDGQTDTQQLTITVQTPVLQPNELCSDYPSIAIATFEDANLESVIRDTLLLGAQDDLTCGLIVWLTELDAPSLAIASLMGVQNLTGVISLNLSKNSISDIGPLSGLSSLKALDVMGNSISDISGLGGLTSLTHLYLHQNSISDISALSGLTSLGALKLQDNSISDISALSGLTGLTSLALSGNSLSDIGPLSGLTNVRSLDVMRNSISDIGALSGLTSLRWLSLRHNVISDISALSGLDSLTYLYLEDNSISDISALSGLDSLTYLDLGMNAISDIGALSGLASLTALSLTGNSISDISALSGLMSLTNLFLGDNAITDIGPLSGLTNLTYLGLDNNPHLTDIQPLLDNSGLGPGDEVYLAGTTVGCTDVATLQAKGVTVYSDCP